MNQLFQVQLRFLNLNLLLFLITFQPNYLVFGMKLKVFLSYALLCVLDDGIGSQDSLFGVHLGDR